MSRLQSASSVLRWAVAPTLVAICAVIALLHPNSAWLSAAVSFTVAVSLVATVCAAFGNRRRRALRSGFAICCGGYFLLYWFGYRPDAGGNSYLEALITTKSLNWLHDRVFPDSSVKLVPEYPAPDSQTPGLPPQAPSPKLPPATPSLTSPFEKEASDAPKHVRQDVIYLAQVAAVGGGMGDDEQVAQNFVQIGQCVWALFFGWLGGWFAQFLAWRQAKANSKAASAPLPGPAEAVVSNKPIVAP